MEIAMIMLAAGESRRFGSNKLLHLVDGKKMYSRILGELCRAREILEAEGRCKVSLTVVTGYEEIRRAALDAGARVFINPAPWEGISSSLKIGLKENMEADACLFTVSDQPYLQAETICTVVRAFLTSPGKAAACAALEGVPVNPCIFSASCYPELLALTGDRGGKKVLLAHREDTVFCEVKDAAEMKDMDTPEAAGKSSV